MKIPLFTQDREILERTPYPFLVMSDSDPLTRLIGAQFLTDAGSELRKVFLLVQKDQYRMRRDELLPFSNKDIEDCWHRAFSFYSEEKQGYSLIILADQISEKGRLRPFQPLFFCRNKELFFHPPCPKCGLLLQQCDHDDFLINSGLEAYSSSLKRYLYCPSCSSSGSSDFYVYELDNSDPPFLKDRRTLIKEFGFLRERRVETDLPCSDCMNHQECYGPEQQVYLRIVPFSFYSFYMLMFEAMSLNAPDFLSLISGARFEELESNLARRREFGRISCVETMKKGGLVEAPLFFSNDERNFLEVLYLKLTFLGEVFKKLFPGGDLFKHPDLRLCIDRMWVKLSEQSTLLPFFWNFRVELLDISMPFPDVVSFPKFPASNTLFFLGLTWFYTFLVNSEQDSSKVSHALQEAAKNFSFDGDCSLKGYSMGELNPAFLPGNIFWNPAGKTVDKNWNIFWEKSLCLGWDLLKTGFHSSPEMSKEEFQRQLESLREEIRGSLFAKELIADRLPVPSETVETNEAIHDILTRIINKWHMEIGAEKEELEETVVLTPEIPRKEVSTSPSPIDKQPEEDESLAETIILMPENIKDKKKGKISEYRNSSKRIGQRDQDNL